MGRTVANCNKILILQKQIIRMLDNFKGNLRDMRTQTDCFQKYILLKANKIYSLNYFSLLKKRSYTQTQRALGQNVRCEENICKKTPKVRTNCHKQHFKYDVSSLLNRIEGVKYTGTPGG